MRLRHLVPGPHGPRRVLLLTLLIAGVVLSTYALATEERVAPKPNYDLASRWMATKVGKLVFDTSVSAHWAEASDRFWYAFETAQGRKFVLVDPIKRTKTPLWDNAKMAAMLTGITRIPYDSQHLPIQPTTMKWGWMVSPQKPQPPGWRATYIDGHRPYTKATCVFYCDADWAVLWPYYCSPFPFAFPALHRWCPA